MNKMHERPARLTCLWDVVNSSRVNAPSVWAEGEQGEGDGGRTPF